MKERLKELQKKFSLDDREIEALEILSSMKPSDREGLFDREKFSLSRESKIFEWIDGRTLEFLPELKSCLEGSQTLPYVFYENLRALKSQKSYPIASAEEARHIGKMIEIEEVVFLYSNDFYEDSQVLASIAQNLSRPIYQLVQFPRDIESRIRLQNYLRMSGSIVLLPVEDDSKDRDLIDWMQSIEGFSFFALLSAPNESLKKNLLRPSYELFWAKKKRSLWGFEIDRRGLEISSDDLRKLEHFYPFRLSKIERVLNEIDIQGGRVSYQEVAAECRLHSSRALESFAKRIRPNYGFDDLILPAHTKLKIYECLEFIQKRAEVEATWKFKEKHTRGHGITLVFEGASGTGKTMAAEVMAKELGMDLYQVDLASLTSKYVGETEKNLSKIFEAARESSGVLLFDEGDALFSKRSDVSSSQDRYANLEVNFLLQELESFDGIVIISTNFANYIDAAFLRRITYQVNFPRPDDEGRKLIWMKNLAQSNTSEIDFDFLSSLPLSGGLIRNVIRQAAALSTEKGLRMEHLLHGVKREYQKLHLPIERETFGDKYWRIVSSEWEMATAERRAEKLQVIG